MSFLSLALSLFFFLDKSDPRLRHASSCGNGNRRVGGGFRDSEWVIIILSIGCAGFANSALSARLFASRSASRVDAKGSSASDVAKAFFNKFTRLHKGVQIRARTAGCRYRNAEIFLSERLNRPPTRSARRDTISTGNLIQSCFQFA